MAKFDEWAQRKLLELAEIDGKITKAQYRVANLPQLPLLATAQNVATRLRQDEIALITYIADLELDIAKVEEDVEVVRLRSAKDQELLNSGAISDSKQLSELQHEVTSLGRRQAELEDAEIEVMQKQENYNLQLAEVRKQMTDQTVVVAELEAEIAAQQNDINSELEMLQTLRADVVSALPAELTGLYEKIRTDNDGVGAALLQQQKCLGCGMQLAPNAIQHARTAASDELIRCEECRAILVRTEESGL